MEDKIDFIFKGISKAESDRSQLRKVMSDQSLLIETLIKRVSVAEEMSKRVPSIEAKFADLVIKVSNNEDNINCLVRENRDLKSRMEENAKFQSKSDQALSISIDDVEQHDRNELIYINGLVVDEAKEKIYGHRQAAMMAVDEAFRPLIEANKGSLQMPTEKWGDYLKNAHCLPIPENAPVGAYKCKPILARFKFRSLKDFILRNKDSLSVRLVDQNLGTAKYSLSAALTKKRYKFLSELIKSKHWYKIWHIDGKHIKMIKKKGDTMKKVKFFEFSKEQLMAM